MAIRLQIQRRCRGNFQHMVTNGKSPTAQEINGIVFDLNRITRREFKRFMADMEAADPAEAEDLTGEFYERVIVSWPYGDVSAAVYLELGMMDAQTVDLAFQEAADYLGKKNLARQSILVAGTDNP